jgi:predicted signal transduction protein with EAL and GGDEF domain
VSSPEHGDEFDDLLRHADVAMCAAKQNGSEVVAFDPMLDTSDPARLSLLADLRTAIAQPEQIVVHYQPQAELATGRISGAEALVRWQHPVHGLISPDMFIPLAERTGIIRPLTWCILHKALEQIREWAEVGLSMRVSVNISPRCLLEAGFADGVSRLLHESGVPVERLQLELTETAIMTDPERAMAVLRDLHHRHGVGRRQLRHRAIVPRAGAKPRPQRGGRRSGDQRGVATPDRDGMPHRSGVLPLPSPGTGRLRHLDGEPATDARRA